MPRTPHRPLLPIALLVASALSAPIVALAAGSGSLPPTQLAYVDPGSGSFILQALVATLAGAAVAINAYWAKLKRFFGRDSTEEDDPTGDPPNDA